METKKYDRKLLCVSYDEQLTVSLRRELQDLTLKIEKLKKFIESHRAAAPISSLYLQSMQQQYCAMDEYKDALKKRLDILEELETHKD